jgi:hypothetical protein
VRARLGVLAVENRDFLPGEQARFKLNSCNLKRMRDACVDRSAGVCADVVRRPAPSGQSNNKEQDHAADSVMADRDHPRAGRSWR